MQRLFRSLRFRLVLTFVAVVGVINAILGLGGVVVRDIQVRSRFDAQLAERADRIALWLGRELDRRSSPGGEGVLSVPTRPFVNSDLYVLVRDAGGNVLDASDTLRNQVLPMPAAPPPAERTSVSAPVFETLRGESVQVLAGQPKSVRMVVRPIVLQDRPGLILQVGASLDELEEAMAFLRTLFWIVMPVGLVAAGLAAYVVTDRWLGPLSAISAVASGMTPEHLDQRVRVKAGHDEVGQLVAEVNHMLSRLERSFKAQENFLSSASHELQTPVAVVLSEAQLLLRREPTGEEYRSFARSVEQEMRQLSRMVWSLLSVTRMETGDLVRTGKLVPVMEVLVSAVDDAGVLARRRGVRLRLALPEDAPEPVVRGDPELLRILFENLLQNAVRNSDDEVGVTLELDADQALVTVTDEGPSIPEEALRSLFERKGTGAGGDGRAGRDTGLGIALAKTVAELHGGALGVRNLDGRGAAFFTWLPLVVEGHVEGTGDPVVSGPLKPGNPAGEM